MPGATPNFAIPYPCAGETIDPAVFAAWANGIDAALLAVDTLADAALVRPAASVITATTGTSTAVGVATTMAYTSTEWASGITVGGSSLTIVTPGVYMVTLQAIPLNAGTTVTSWACNITLGGVTQYRRKLGINAANTTAIDLNISGLISCAAATVLAATWTWTGTGGPMFVFARLGAAMLCDL